MQDLTTFILEFKGVLTALVGLIGAISALIAGIVKVYRLIIKKISDIDDKQNIRLDKIENKMDNTINIQNTLAANLTTLLEMHKDDPDKRALKNKISKSIQIKFDNRDIKNMELKSIFYSGENAVFEIIDLIFDKDFLNITKKFDFGELKDKSINKLKAIKNNINTSKLNVSDDFPDMLKEFIYIRLDEFIEELMKVKKGYYNGTSKEKFEDAFTKLTENIIEDTIKLYTEKLTENVG